MFVMALRVCEWSTSYNTTRTFSRQTDEDRGGGEEEKKKRLPRGRGKIKRIYGRVSLHSHTERTFGYSPFIS